MIRKLSLLSIVALLGVAVACGGGGGGGRDASSELGLGEF